jgi:CheY-like chemotaxis protein
MPTTILVVEDETLVAIMVQDMLEELGFAVLGPAGSVAAAFTLLDGAAPAAAVLDCNLGQEKVWPIAERLQHERVPFVFSTGYGAAGIDPRFTSAPVLAKPYDRASLRTALERVLGRGSSS